MDALFGVLTMGSTLDYITIMHSQQVTRSVFLCGYEDMVKTAKRCCFLANAAFSNIHTDPFSSAR